MPQPPPKRKLYSWGKDSAFEASLNPHHRPVVRRERCAGAGPSPLQKPPPPLPADDHNPLLRPVRARTLRSSPKAASSARIPLYPVWRAGANAATLFDSPAELTIGSLAVPAGKHSLFVLLDKSGWKLIVNKQTGQSGLDYDASQDLGRVPMQMSKAPTLLETYKITLTPTGGNRGRLTLAWEHTVASVDFTVK